MQPRGFVGAPGLAAFAAGTALFTAAALAGVHADRIDSPVDHRPAAHGTGTRAGAGAGAGELPAVAR